MVMQIFDNQGKIIMGISLIINNIPIKLVGVALHRDDVGQAGLPSVILKMGSHKITKVTPPAHLFLFLPLTRASSARCKNKKRPLTCVNDLCALVGVAGFEPAAPCSQNRCANRTAPRPETIL